MTTFSGWDLPYLGGDQLILGGEFCLGGIAPHWGWTGLRKKCLSLPIEGRPPKQRVVAYFRNVHDNVEFYFYSTSMFVKCLAIKVI